MPGYGLLGFPRGDTILRLQLSGYDYSEGGIYTASTYYVSSPPDRAFDGFWSTDGTAWMSNNINTNQWIACQLSVARIIKKLRIRNGAPQTANRAAQHCYFQGSLDGAAWDKIPAIGAEFGAVLYNVDEFTLANDIATY